MKLGSFLGRSTVYVFLFFSTLPEPGYHAASSMNQAQPRLHHLEKSHFNIPTLKYAPFSHTTFSCNPLDLRIFCSRKTCWLSVETRRHIKSMPGIERVGHQASTSHASTSSSTSSIEGKRFIAIRSYYANAGVMLWTPLHSPCSQVAVNHVRSSTLSSPCNMYVCKYARSYTPQEADYQLCEWSRDISTHLPRILPAGLSTVDFAFPRHDVMSRMASTRRTPIICIEFMTRLARLRCFASISRRPGKL